MCSSNSTLQLSSSYFKQTWYKVQIRDYIVSLDVQFNMYLRSILKCDEKKDWWECLTEGFKLDGWHQQRLKLIINCGRKVPIKISWSDLESTTSIVLRENREITGLYHITTLYGSECSAVNLSGKTWQKKKGVADTTIR